MDAGPVLQENVSTTNIKAFLSLKYSQMDELTGVEDDVQIGGANQLSGNSKLDKVGSI